MTRRRRLVTGPIPLVLSALLALVPLIAVGGDLGEAQQRYREFLQTQPSRGERLPFQIRTEEDEDVLRSSVRVVLAGVAFDEVARALSTPAEWCELAPMHLNVKACTYDDSDTRPQLRFYVGRKYFQTPEDASALTLDFAAAVEPPRLLSVRLEADEGPYGTSDYRFHLLAIPAADGTFLTLDLSSRLGMASSALDAYFYTLGREKIGFSKVSEDGADAGYVRGTQGANERNVVRYLLALKVYFQTLALPEEDRFRVRAERWYEATEAFPAQLYELDRDEYLEAKAKERHRQQVLQRRLEQGA